MLQTFTLSNGIKVATYQMTQVKSFHLGITVKGGSLVEKSEENGIAHFMEHMLAQGIPSYPSAELLSNYVESLAGRYNAFTSLFTVHFAITLPFSVAEEGIKIASEVFFQPLFPIQSLEKERQAVLNEMKQDMDSRWYKFQEFFRMQRFTPRSPLQRKVLGTPDVIVKLTREDLMKYWQTYFVPKNTYLFVQGNFEQQTLRTWLETYFSPFTSKKKFVGYPTLSAVKDFSPRHLSIRHDPTLQVNYIDLSFPSLTLLDPVDARAKQNMALIILGGLRTSRLFRLLRYQKGLVYGISSGNMQFPGVGYSTVSSEVATKHLDEVMTLIVSEMKQFMRVGPTEEELRLIKHYLSNSWLMAFDNPASIGDWIESDFLWKEKILLPEEYIALIKDVTAAELVKLMQTRWELKKLNVLIQGPLADSSENRKKYDEMVSGLG